MVGQSTFLGRLPVTVAAWLALFYLAIPLVIVSAVSVTNTEFLAFPPQGLTLRWYSTVITDSSYVKSFLLSGYLAAISTVAAVFLGVPTALILARKEFPGRQAIGALFLSPLILPTIVLGVVVLQFSARAGFPRSFYALLLGHVIVTVPYVVRTTLASLAAGFDLATEEAAQDLGAAPMQVFFLVTLPQIKQGVITGALFAFLMSWINVEVSIFNTTPTLETLPVKLMNYIQYNVDPSLAAVSATTIFIAVAAVLILDLTIGVEKATRGL
ncbi:MAG: ABC transporter permease [Alphaproteobacteria bacterium]|nr:ABC transporter permease [Alphaproteobacteria bacterium]